MNKGIILGDWHETSNTPGVVSLEPLPQMKGFRDTTPLFQAV